MSGAQRNFTQIGLFHWLEKPTRAEKRTFEKRFYPLLSTSNSTKIGKFSYNMYILGCEGLLIYSLHTENAKSVSYSAVKKMEATHGVTGLPVVLVNWGYHPQMSKFLGNLSFR